jgi:hypothetical protein
MFGEPPAGESLDPSLAATVRRLPDLDDAPDPEPVFAARLEGELLRHAGPIHLVPSGPDLRFPAAGSDRAVVRHERPNPTGQTAMNIVAAAALLAIVVASTLVALWAGPLERLDSDRPRLVLAPGITDEQLLLQARFDAVPDGVLSATISRWVLQPGAEVTMGPQEPGGKAPAAYLVEAGALSVLPNVSVPVTRAGETTPTPVPEAAWTTLLPGDRMFVPEDVTSLWRNDGAHPVRILEATFASREIQPQPAGVLNYQVISEWPYAKPDHPIIMNVIEVTLHPEGSLPIERVPGLAMLKVESGRLVAIDVDDAGNSLPPLELGQATRFLGSFPPGRVFRSGNDEPVKLLLVTILDANPLGAGA